MRLVFAGTPEAAVPSLRLLAASAHDIVCVITRRDAPVGRRRTLTPSPVAQVADELGIPVIKTDRLDDEATARVQSLAPDLGVIVAYGGLVREPLLSAPAHGWINLHFSLLPKWRGAAPVQRALIAGDEVTGASVFQLVAELDAGAVFEELTYTVPEGATAGTVLADLAESGADLLAGVIDAIADGRAVATPQTGEPTVAAKLTAEDGRLNWQEDAATVLARLRGVTPEPGAYTTVGDARVKVLAARPGPPDSPNLSPGELAFADRVVLIGTGSDPIALQVVQPAGKGQMAAADWWRGLRSEQPAVAS